MSSTWSKVELCTTFIATLNRWPVLSQNVVSVDLSKPKHALLQKSRILMVSWFVNRGRNSLSQTEVILNCVPRSGQDLRTLNLIFDVDKLLKSCEGAPGYVCIHPATSSLALYN